MRLLILTGLLFPLLSAQSGRVFTVEKSEISFLSDAPLEMIKASSEKLRGALNLTDRSFSFAVAVPSFEGFNSSLQKTHFNQDYMESHLYPDFVFKGKLIEDSDLSVPGDYKIRAKGRLNIHGIETDRIIRCDVKTAPGSITVHAEFTVFIADHNIKIPSILNQKIAEEIKVNVQCILKPYKP